MPPGTPAVQEPPPVAAESASDTVEAPNPEADRAGAVAALAMEDVGPKGGAIRCAREVTIILALDYGTHSTKVMWRRRGDASAHVLALEAESTYEDPSYPWFAVPSVVAVDAGRLYFGRQALARAAGSERGTVHLLRYLKVGLMDADGRGVDLGTSAAPGVDAPRDLLVCASLVHVLREARASLARRFPGAAVKPILHVGVPATNADDGDLRERYERLVQPAWEALASPDGPAIEQGTSVAEARRLLEPWLAGHVPLPPWGERRWRVIPESVAALVSVQQTGRLAPGIVQIVDVGAGSTDMSVNEVGVPELDGRIHCFQCSSPRVGVSRLRTERAAGLLERLQRDFVELWQGAYGRVRRNPMVARKWHRLSVLLLGGGARLPEVRKSIGTSRPFDSVCLFHAELDVLPSHVPSYVLPDSNGTLCGDADLLTVAHGLLNDN